MSDQLTHAMVLAAGLGTRMRPITNIIPKPLVEVGGRSMLDRNIDQLHAHGVRNIVVNGHHLLPKMEAHIEALNDENIHLSPEPELLDQGGGIRQALPILGEGDFFILNGDAFWNDDLDQSALGKLEELWDPQTMDFLLLLAPMTRSTGFAGPGDFFLEADQRLRFRDEAERAPFVYTGAGVFSRRVFEDQMGRVFPLVPLFRQAAKAGRLFGAELSGHWFHIGTPDAIALAEQEMAQLGLTD